MRYQLIIFDLDDTLIDSSTKVIPMMLENSLRAMIKAGLSVDSFETVYAQLLEISNRCHNGKQTLSTFLEQINAHSPNNKVLFEIGVKEYYGKLAEESADAQINPLPYTLESLNILNSRLQLALVSSGEKKTQLLKMQKAGISNNLFKSIIITEDYDKKEHYQKIVNNVKINPAEILVCGDKQSDLQPAKELGMSTVLMRWGRGRNITLNEACADFSINNLKELVNIIKP